MEKGALKSPKMIHILHLSSGGQASLNISVDNRNNGEDEKQSFLCEINVIDLD